MLNSIAIAGRLTRDPELHRTGSGLAVTSYTVAVDRDIPESDGSRKADFFDCVAWREKGEFVSKYFQKGSMIIVKGRMQARDWQDKEGNKRRSWELIADNVYFGGNKKDDNQQTGNQSGYGGYAGGNAYPEATAAANRYIGGYAAPQNPGSDFAMLTDDDARLPF